METLTPEVVNKIIKRIEVHNSEMVNGHKRVGIDIHFTGVGLVDLATIKEMLAIAESSRPRSTIEREKAAASITEVATNLS